MQIVSVPGRLVRDPATQRAVDEAGLDIDANDLSWARLLADGDVAEVFGTVEAHLVADEPLAGTGEPIQLPGAVDADGTALPPVMQAPAADLSNKGSKA